MLREANAPIRTCVSPRILFLPFKNLAHAALLFFLAPEEEEEEKEENLEAGYSGEIGYSVVFDV